MKEKQGKLAKLQELGFSKTKSAQALKDAGNNFDLALRILLKQQEQQQQRQQRIVQNPPAKAPDYTEEEEEEEKEEQNTTLKKERKHPCIVQFKTCRYGEACLLRHYPGDVCINYFMGGCLYGSCCKKRHYVDGVDIRAGIRREVQDNTMKLQTGEIVKLENISGHHLLSGKPVKCGTESNVGNSEIAVAPPPPNRFNLIQGSEPTHTDPHATDWQMRPAASLTGAQAPCPFLEVVRKKTSTQQTTVVVTAQAPSSSSSLLQNGVTVSTATTKKKHPCIAQFGSCRYGDQCIHADRDEDVCVFFLNNRCKNGAKCQYRHETNAEFLRRLKPQLRENASPQEEEQLRVGTVGLNEMQGNKYEQVRQRQTPPSPSLSWDRTPEPIYLSSLLPKMEADESFSHMEESLPSDKISTKMVDDNELDALTALVEAFPQIEPCILIHALRSANGDVNLVACTLTKLNSFDTIEDVNAYLSKERAEEDASLEHMKVESKQELLFTLCTLFPALDVPSIEAVLDRCDGDYAEAYGILLCSTENIVRGDLRNYWNGTIKPADEVRLGKLCSMFSAVPKEVVRSTFGAADGNLTKAIAALNDMTRDTSIVEEERNKKEIQKTVPIVCASASASGSFSTSMSLTGEESSSFLLRPSSTIEEIQKFYKDVDAELRELGDWRRVRDRAYIVNSCRIRTLSQATEAYMRGDSKTAKTLSRYGKQLGAEYAHLNRIAMVALERERLSKDPTSTLDLHGFHVDEAVEVLRRRVELCVIKGIRRLTIVVGSGRHSRRGVSIIYPVVLQHLNQDPQLQKFVKVRSIKPAYFEVNIIQQDKKTN